MRKLIVFLLGVASVSVFSQHYVSQPHTPQDKTLYENKPSKKSVSTDSTRYTSALLEKIHRRVTLHEYHRGKSCGIFIKIDTDKRQLSKLRISDCTMGRDFEQQLPQIISNAIESIPMPQDGITRLTIQHQSFTFIPRFNGPVKSDKPSSFSKTYVMPQK
ncbi:hypothetical protein [Rheinheimera sp.]|uniref:hypothetical protein n=1 Tax=Rheinheimera sp. TaxID=1869214 RepID=UPI002609ACE6|nr:hypothetical protein [Rheinheimera sp.]MCA1930902.1 hypothetical protein [Rheinheimera sp.]